MSIHTRINVDVRITCQQCKQEHTLKDVPLEGLIKRYRDREMIQNCFPSMPVADRELFISGICDDCYTVMIEEEEDE